MKKHYLALCAEDVPHYGIATIDAADDAAAIKAAKALSLTGITIDPDYETSTCKRIVHIEDEDGNIIAQDMPLDSCFLRYGGEPEKNLCNLAPDLLAALRTIAEIPLYEEPLPASLEPLKADLIADHEYDEVEQVYTPCVDTESGYLEHAVETARAVLARAKGDEP